MASMPEKSEFRTVARPGSEQSRLPEPPRKASTVSWRTISLISAPVVLGLINLVDAYVDKQKAIFEGDQLYRTEVESGKAEAKAILARAEESGKIKKVQLLDGAEKESTSIGAGAAARAEETNKQALSETEMIREQAKRTKEAVSKYLAK
jgi:hypothetical protein